MTAAAAPTEGLSFYPHKVLTTIAREVGRSRDRDAAIVRMLAERVERVETAMVDELRRASPRTAARVALDLHERHWRALASAMQLASDLAAERGVPERTFAEDVVEGVKRLADDTRRTLPKLPPDARKHVRATATLAIERGALAALANWSWSGPPGTFGAVLQALMVIGRRGGVPEAVADALALELWRVARSDVDEETVENAYWSAVAAESVESGEKVVPFRPRTARKPATAARRTKKTAG
jgi:hypothetical protein